MSIRLNLMWFEVYGFVIAAAAALARGKVNCSGWLLKFNCLEKKAKKKKKIQCLYERVPPFSSSISIKVIEFCLFISKSVFACASTECQRHTLSEYMPIKRTSPYNVHIESVIFKSPPNQSQRRRKKTIELLLLLF